MLRIQKHVDSKDTLLEDRVEVHIFQLQGDGNHNEFFSIYFKLFDELERM